MRERRGDLPVQFLAVGDDNHARMAVGQLHQDVFRQHHHRETFAAALRVPDDSTLPVAVTVVLRDCRHDLLDGEILLVAADLLDVPVKEDEVANKLKDALLAEQGYQGPVLLRRQSPGNQVIQRGEIAP